MAGMSKEQQLEVFIGTNTKVGTLTLPIGSEANFKFHYEQSWIENGFPISPYIPFDHSGSSRSINNFLRNLLPEGESFDEMIQNTTITRNNTFGLIKLLGLETSGALSFRTPGDAAAETQFREVTEEELTDRLDKSVQPIIFWDGKVRLSVAGVQNKLNLLKRGDKMGFGEGKLSSNYILKFESGRIPCIAINEFFCMNLANQIGMNVANVQIQSFGNTRTLLIECFDRQYDPERDIVRRMHVVDGCQIADLPPSFKYERQNGDSGDSVYMRDGVSFPKLFNVETMDNAFTRTRLIEWMIFNLATLNYDAHGKNISFFIRPSGVSLAPFYDLVNIQAIVNEGAKRNAMSGQLDSESGRTSSIPQFFAMSIGDWENPNYLNPPTGNFERPITAYNFADFANTFGISPTYITTIVTNTLNSLLDKLPVAGGLANEKADSAEEKEHIEMCIDLIKAECEYLLVQASQIEAMYEYL
jgi:serine/threonine-protein kinase HipA